MTTIASELERGGSVPFAQADADEVRIELTEAGRENLRFRCLSVQAVPMLRHPERFAQEQREQVARALEQTQSGLDDSEFSGESDLAGEDEDAPEPEFDPSVDFDLGFDMEEPW